MTESHQSIAARHKPLLPISTPISLTHSRPVSFLRAWECLWMWFCNPTAVCDHDWVPKGLVCGPLATSSECWYRYRCPVSRICLCWIFVVTVWRFQISRALVYYIRSSSVLSSCYPGQSGASLCSTHQCNLIVIERFCDRPCLWSVEEYAVWIPLWLQISS